MILVKLVAVCEAIDCASREGFEVELSNFSTDEGFYLDLLPRDWSWVYDVTGGGGMYRRSICPNCSKERKK